MKCRDASEIIELLKKEKNKQRLTNIQLAKLSGVSEGTLNKIFGTETSNPSINNILKIVGALNLPDEIFYKKDETKQLDSNESELLDLYRQLQQRDQGRLLGYARCLVDKYDEEYQKESS